MDLRGHGLSDAPTETAPTTSDVLAEDVVAVAEGSGCSARTGRTASCSRATASARSSPREPRLELGDRCAGLVLVDGGWESLEAATGMDVDEFLRGLDEPPEVMRSLTAYLADRARVRPATGTPTRSGRPGRRSSRPTRAGSCPPTRPHALEASVRAMFTYDPIATLRGVRAPVVALVAADDEDGSRARALARRSAARVAAGRRRSEPSSFGHDGHNLMRYRPREVSAAILVGSPRPAA